MSYYFIARGKKGQYLDVIYEIKHIYEWPQDILFFN